MPFPPPEEGLYVPAQSVNLCNLFCSQVVPVGGYPVVFSVYVVADKSQFFLSLVDTLGAKKHNAVIKDDPSRCDGMLSYDRLVGVLLDPADKELFVLLPLVKVIVRLIPAIHDTSFAFGDNLCNKGALPLVAVGEVDLPGNSPVDVKPDVRFRLLCSVTIISPLHGEDCVDQGAVDCHEVAEMSILCRKSFPCLLDEVGKDFFQLLKAPVVDCLKEGALLDPLWRGNAFFGKIILFKCLEQLST